MLACAPPLLGLIISSSAPDFCTQTYVNNLNTALGKHSEVAGLGILEVCQQVGGPTFPQDIATAGEAAGQVQVRTGLATAACPALVAAVPSPGMMSGPRSR